MEKGREGEQSGTPFFRSWYLPTSKERGAGYPALKQGEVFRKSSTDSLAQSPSLLYNGIKTRLERPAPNRKTKGEATL